MLLFRQLAFNLGDTYSGIILPQAFAPATVLILKGSFDQIPVELEDEARVDGANRLPAPLVDRVASVTPDPCSGSDFVFISAWNNYFWPFIVTTDAGLMTLPVDLRTVKSADGRQYAQNLASAIPPRCRRWWFSSSSKGKSSRELPPLVSVDSSRVANSSGRRDSRGDPLKSSSL